MNTRVYQLFLPSENKEITFATVSFSALGIYNGRDICHYMWSLLNEFLKLFNFFFRIIIWKIKCFL